MSFIFMGLQSSLSHKIISKAVPVRYFICGATLRSEETEKSRVSEKDEKVKDPSKDRRKPIPVETSIRYLASDAFKKSYAGHAVWELYRRNHKGQLPPEKTRKTCIRQGFISTGNPCPICRDEYLVLDHRNVTLLKQFISEINGEVFSYKKTGLCQRQHQNLLIAIHRAKDYGTITFHVPFRKYDYSDWYKPEEEAL